MASGQLTPHYEPANPRKPIFLRSQVEHLIIPSSREPLTDQRMHDAVKKRDKYACAICKQESAAIVAHHVIPIDQGGQDNELNLITLCTMCHAAIHGALYGIAETARKNNTVRVLRRLCTGVLTVLPPPLITE
jgi:5-methylcytosine-specific restriction endonuclease McrA